MLSKKHVKVGSPQRPSLFWKGGIRYSKDLCFLCLLQVGVGCSQEWVGVSTRFKEVWFASWMVLEVLDCVQIGLKEVQDNIC